jgi:hypothetical protein
MPYKIKSRIGKLFAGTFRSKADAQSIARAVRGKVVWIKNKKRRKLW